MTKAQPPGKAKTAKIGRILLCNDDGINAPGLKILRKIADTLSDDVWTVAPEYEQSGAAHSLTLTEPLRLRKLSKRRYSVRGTPTDCVLMAMDRVLTDLRPDLLLSGVNRGANAGEDVTYSGTVAAAMEGTLLGVPSIALSQSYVSGHPVKWATAEHHAPDLVRRLVAVGWPANVLININFPAVTHQQVKAVEVVPQGFRDISNVLMDERIDARNVPYYWLGFRKESDRFRRNTDLAALQDGAISVTPLHLDLTAKSALKKLKSALD